MKSLLGSILFITAYLLTPEVTSAQLKLHHDKDTGTITVNKTEDGQFYSGVIEGENDRQVLLRIPNVDESVSIPKSIIWDKETANMSMMPEGLLEYLSDDEVINIIAYLQSFDNLSSK